LETETPPLNFGVCDDRNDNKIMGDMC